MQVKRVKFFSKDYKKICKLLCTSLPRQEHLPLSLIYLLSLRKDIHYLSFYDNETLVGLMYTITTKELDYLLYLVVDPNIRSKGYGSQMMAWVKNKNGEKPMALDIETLDEKASNYEQRIKRYHFYQKNGFIETESIINYNDNDFIIMTNKNTFDKNALIKLFKSFTYHLYKPNIRLK